MVKEFNKDDAWDWLQENGSSFYRTRFFHTLERDDGDLVEVWDLDAAFEALCERYGFDPSTEGADDPHGLYRLACLYASSYT